ncbi:MAG: hypothetical protein AAF004_12895 [Pseudomonadota bacterium]
MKIMNLVRFTAIVILAACSVQARATDVSYDFAELRFVDADVEGFDGDGLQLGGSYNVSGNWLVIGSIQLLDFDGADLDILKAGGGYVWSTDERFDLFATGALVRFDAGDNENGFEITGGIRSKFNEHFEGRASINYSDVVDADTYVQLGGDYYFTPEFAAGATVDLGGDFDSITFGVRWFFGGRRISK